MLQFLLSFVTIEILSFVTNEVFEICPNLSFWVLSLFEFISFFPQQLELLNFVLSQFMFFTILIFKFCQDLILWALLQFKLLSFIIIWFFSQFVLLTFVAIWSFKFCHNFGFEFGCNLIFSFFSNNKNQNYLNFLPTDRHHIRKAGRLLFLCLSAWVSIPSILSTCPSSYFFHYIFFVPKINWPTFF